MLNGTLTMGSRRWALVCSVVLAALGWIPADAFGQTVIYVDANSTTDPADGMSWATAFRDLQEGLDQAALTPGSVEIWMADGRYVPSYLMDAGDPRSATFLLRDDVAIYGGFAGTESSRDERDLSSYETILSGDINGDDCGSARAPTRDAVNESASTPSGWIRDAQSREPDRNRTGAYLAIPCSADSPSTILTSFQNVRPADAARLVAVDPSIGTNGLRLHLPEGATAEVSETPLDGTDESPSSLNGHPIQTPGVRLLTAGYTTACCTDNKTDNAYHVVTADGVGPTAILDGVTVRGGSADVPRPDPRHRGGGVFCDSDASPTIRHCIIECNYATNGGGVSVQGGSAPTLSHCTIRYNWSAGAGGMNSWQSTPVVTDCTFLGNSGLGTGPGGLVIGECNPNFTRCVFDGNNSAGGPGGAINIWGGASSTLTGCTFTGNEAGSVGGGAIYVNSTSALDARDCTFTANGSAANGGGVLVANAQGVFVRCTFVNNQAERGGGLCVGSSGVATVVNSRFLGNRAAGSSTDPKRGGGAFVYGSGAFVEFTNCVFSGNEAISPSWSISSYGGGLGVTVPAPTVTVTNCTFFGNFVTGPFALFGGGIWLHEDTSATVSNSIFRNNTDRSGSNESSQIYLAPRASVTLSYSCVENWSAAGLGGSANIAADPRLVDPEGSDGLVGTMDDNVRLLLDSPAIDAGNNDLVPAGVTLDLDGLPRFMDIAEVPDTGNGTPPIVDMGAYEAQHDCNGNGVDDQVDIETGTSQDCNLNARPDECDLDAWISADCNDNGYPDECETQTFHDCCGVGHGPGCSAPRIADCVCALDPYCCNVDWDRVCVKLVDSGTCGTCDIPQADDCDANGVPDQCEPDFDGDGLIDACDPDIDNDGVLNPKDVCDYTPPGAQVEPNGGVLGDVDGDCDVDLEDFALMQSRFTGPGSR